MTRRLVIVGNPSCRRVACWQQALACRSWPSAKLVSAADLITGCSRLGDHLTADDVVRFESLAENWETMKLLLKHGVEPARAEGYPVLKDREIDELRQERGWVVAPRQGYLGFARLLRALRRDLDASGAESLNHPDDVVLLFDKPRCQQHLEQAGIPIPASTGTARDYADIRARYGPSRRIMVKLAHGSGAAGCVALHWAQGRTRALTTVVEVTTAARRKLYCSKKVQVLTSELEIAGLVDRLCIDGVQVEDWLPKARWQGQNFDLRIVTIAGSPRHAVARVSASTFTNLTLGNRRGDLDAIVERMGRERWGALRTTCARVAGLLPGSQSLGIDVLVHPDWQRHSVLEVNAFGELLPGVLDNGEDTYTAVLSAWERQHRLALVGS